MGELGELGELGALGAAAARLAWLTAALLCCAGCSAPSGDGARGSASGRGASPSSGPTETALAATAELPTSDGPHDRELRAMGGVAISVRAWGPASSLERAMATAARRVASFEQEASVFRADSFLSRLNQAGGRALPASPEMIAIVSDSIRLARVSGGAFDPTVGPLVELWRRSAADGQEPTPRALEAARRLVGWSRIRLSSPPTTLALEGGARLDLGALAEGHLADLLASVLRAEGIVRARIDVGGDLLTFDDRSAPAPFRIGIRHPAADGLLGEVELASGAVATSGCYERAWMIGGKRHCHVVDPRSGQTVAGTLAATVLAPRAVDADALATAVLVLGAASGLELLAGLKDVDGLVVSRAADGSGVVLAASPGFARRFSLRAKLPAASPSVDASVERPAAPPPAVERPGEGLPPTATGR